MKRIFTSGGTTGQSRLVTHSEIEWKGIVIDTALVMRAYGVGSGDKVLIGQPSFPWSIGQAFADAAISCGADAICLGSHAAHLGLVKEALELSPGALIVPPRLPLIWAKAGIPPVPGIRIIVVGEPLPDWLEAELIESWNPLWIRRIYGHSELGTLAYQPTDESAFLLVNPRFDFAIQPLEGAEVGTCDSGRLLITSLDSGFVVDTGDIATIVDGCCGNALWAGCRRLRVVRRVSPTLYLADGTSIDATFLETLAQEWNLRAIQLVQSPRSETHQKLSISVVASRSIDPAGFRGAVLEAAPELVRLGLGSDGWDVPHVEVKQVELEDLRKTPRGKIPLLIDDCSRPTRGGGVTNES